MHKKSFSLFAISLLAVFVIAGAWEVFDPYPAGPYSVVSLHFPFNETNLAKNVDVWAPGNSKEKATVIYFTGSLAGTITTGAVREFAELLASWGFVLVGPWRAGAPNYTVAFIDPIIDFAEENLLHDLIVTAGSDPDMTLDFSRMIMMGHSAGNHINVNYLKQKCRNFVASVLLSPVDGPLGYCIEPGVLLNYNMPTLVVAAGLDPIPGAPLYPACAPVRLSNQRFYDAMPGNRWYMNATQYGHVDFFEPDFLELVEALSFCATRNETDKDRYRHYTAGTVVAFIKAVVEPERYCGMLQYVEIPWVMRVPTEVTNDVDGSTRCEPARCVWTEPAQF